MLRVVTCNNLKSIYNGEASEYLVDKLSGYLGVKEMEDYNPKLANINNRMENIKEGSPYPLYEDIYSIYVYDSSKNEIFNLTYNGIEEIVIEWLGQLSDLLNLPILDCEYNSYKKIELSSRYTIVFYKTLFTSRECDPRLKDSFFNEVQDIVSKYHPNIKDTNRRILSCLPILMGMSLVEKDNLYIGNLHSYRLSKCICNTNNEGYSTGEDEDFIHKLVTNTLTVSDVELLDVITEYCKSKSGRDISHDLDILVKEGRISENIKNKLIGGKPTETFIKTSTSLF